jgi:two-component system chemotaxis response regulator CheV
MQDNQTNILLETGTNELEIMEFTISGQLFGINVAKVIEIMMSSPVIPHHGRQPAQVHGVWG